MQAHERVAVALDVESKQRALDLVEILSGRVGYFKVGLQLFTAQGPDIVREIVDRGGEVFLDLKLHDIPNTVSKAAVEAARLGASMLTLHSAGGEAMLSKAVGAMRRLREEGEHAPLLLAVTVLTSLGSQDLSALGVERSLEDTVATLAGVAHRCGMDAVVCSPLELPLLRGMKLDGLRFVTPGIRPAGLSKDDQARTLTPAQAISAGADYLVIGRPIVAAADPAQALERILAEMEPSIR